MDSPSLAPWLATHRRGELDAEAAIGLAEVIDAAQQTGKAGTLTITISVKAPRPGARRVTVVDKVAVRKPTHDPEDAVYFIGPGGTLLRDDPDQLAFHEPVRSVDPATGEITK